MGRFYWKKSETNQKIMAKNKNTKQKTKKQDPKKQIISQAKLKRELVLLEKLKQGSLNKAEIKELEEFGSSGKKKRPEEITRLVNLNTLCALINKTPATIDKWRRKGLIQRYKGKLYDLAEVFEGRVDHERKLCEDEIAALEEDLQKFKQEGEDARSKYWKAKSEREENRNQREKIELADQLKEIVYVSDEVQHWATVGTIFKNAAMEITKQNPGMHGLIEELYEAVAEGIRNEIQRLDPKDKHKAEIPGELPEEPKKGKKKK